jgi:hypothetical protein
MKRFLLLAAALFISTSAFAQNFEWGVKAGLNLANVTKSEGMAKMKPSIYAGAFVEFMLGDFVGIQPELVYSRQGYNMKEAGETSNYRMNYINLPVLAKLYVLENLSLDLGPQFGYMIDSKAHANGITLDMDDVLDAANQLAGTDLKINKFDVSFAIGLSYKIAGQFDISARYNLGLTKWNNYDDSKNGVIQIGVGYRF